MLKYYEFTPDDFLQTQLIDCYWSGRVTGTDSIGHLVIPDGCMDVLFKLDDINNTISGRLIGPDSVAKQYYLNNSVNHFGIRFKPGVGRYLFNVDASEITNKAEDLSNFVKPEVLNKLYDLLHSAEGVNDFIKAFNQFLITQANIVEYQQKQSKFSRHLIKIIADLNIVNISVSDLNADTGYSRQHFRRLFLSHVGLSPKAFLDILRLRQVTKQLKRSHGADLAALSLDFGYYDQAHFNHHFKHYIGITPTTFLKR